MCPDPNVSQLAGKSSPKTLRLLKYFADELTAAESSLSDFLL